MATLTAAGWRDEALRVQLSVARAAIALGSPGVARRELGACSALRRHGLIADRIEAWHVEALIRLAGHDPGGAQAAANRGLRLLEAHRAALVLPICAPPRPRSASSWPRWVSGSPSPREARRNARRGPKACGPARCGCRR